jgi:hypothetical protein
VASGECLCLSIKHEVSVLAFTAYCCLSLSAGVCIGAGGEHTSLSIASLTFCIAHHREWVKGSSRRTMKKNGRP